MLSYTSVVIRDTDGTAFSLIQCVLFNSRLGFTSAVTNSAPLTLLRVENIMAYVCQCTLNFDMAYCYNVVNCLFLLCQCVSMGALCWPHIYQSM